MRLLSKTQMKRDRSLFRHELTFNSPMDLTKCIAWVENYNEPILWESSNSVRNINVVCSEEQFTCLSLMF